LLEADAKMSGQLLRPGIEGALQLTRGRIELAGYGDYRDIRLHLTATPHRLELRELVVHGRKGEAKLSAVAQRQGKAYRISSTLDAKDFPFYSQDQLLASLSMRATAHGTGRRGSITLEPVNIREAHVELPDTQRRDLQKLDEPEDIVLVRNGVPLDEEQRGTGGAGTAGMEAAPAKEPVAWRIKAHIQAPRNLWVRGKDVNAELGLSDDFTVDVGEALNLFGTVAMQRGRVEVMGRRFEIDKSSTVRFTGPADSPELDVTALHVNEREDITVKMHISGAPGAIVVEPSSEPPLPETEIYTLIATGRRTLERGSGSTSPSDTAVTLVGSLAASQLKETLSKSLPLDVLSIESGEGGLENARLEAGTYLSDRFYVGYQADLGADTSDGENTHAVRLEYQIGKRWSLESTYGDARAGSADLVWERQY
jgi:translocation and assembly module TamB